MNKLITASDIAKRDKVESVSVWIRVTSTTLAAKGKLKKAWDGQSILPGQPVEAFVNTGRVLAKCDVCGMFEYVSPHEKIFFCMQCGNNESGAVRAVIFPDDWARIEAALLRRAIFLGPAGLDEIQSVLRSKPVIRGLTRNWEPGIRAEDLEAENDRL